MNLSKKAKRIDVVILCGGRGERLKAVINDRPKPMCEFGGRPFLSILMEYAASFGFERFILCSGYKGEMVKEYYKKAPAPWEIVFCQEEKTLGTGGAVRNVRRLIKSDPFLVMNGDSFARVDLNKFIDFHLRKQALLSIALVKDRANKNSGKVVLNQAGRILSFEEKGPRGSKCFDSAGIYLMDKAIFSFIKKTGKSSLEYDLFPSIVGKRCFGYVEEADLVDFGTPKRYQKALRFFAKGTVLK